MDSRWPGDPVSWWERVTPDGRWSPTRADFPACSTPDELAMNYALVPAWWNRAILAGIGAVGIVVCSVGLGLGWWEGGFLRRIVALVLVAVVIVGSVAAIVGWLRFEFKWRSDRQVAAERAFDAVAARDTPIWAISANVIRLDDRTSGEETPDDLLFLLDLRVGPGVLARQAAVIRAWLGAVAESEIGVADFGKAFDNRDSVHCVEVFGEQMRGVWIGRKPSILPHQVLGLAVEDPREAASFTDEHVIFARSPDPEMRRNSRIRR